MIKKNNLKNKGFTIIELIVTIAIFAFMTAFLLAKYGTFNQGILLTNLAYDVALTLRNAQSYGLNVKSQPNASGLPFSSDFRGYYGVHFSTASNTSILFFADINKDGIYTSGNDADISTYQIKRGSRINGLCVGDNCTGSSLSSLDVTFRRPDPDAIIIANGAGAANSYGAITLLSSDGGTRVVYVRGTGQIAISN